MTSDNDDWLSDPLAFLWPEDVGVGVIVIPTAEGVSSAVVLSLWDEHNARIDFAMNPDVAAALASELASAAADYGGSIDALGDDLERYE